MNCKTCNVELNDENLCCDGGTYCKACCDCKEEPKKEEESCNDCGCHCS